MASQNVTMGRGGCGCMPGLGRRTNRISPLAATLAASGGLTEFVDVRPGVTYHVYVMSAKPAPSNVASAEQGAGKSTGQAAEAAASGTSRSDDPAAPAVAETAATADDAGADVGAKSPAVGQHQAESSESQASTDGDEKKQSTKQRRRVAFFWHGVGGDVSLWSEQARAFCAQGYDVVLIDLLGHGKSTVPRERSAYDFKKLASDSEVLFDRYRGDDNVVIGHSYG